ncbi:type VI secretion system lipoprotein TssJ [Vibrio nereis]|uniref:type VI secretion system lipoprotein TssJ n=1 Tax=Vibrio nereis TaxID=693 RepID=UPI002494043C|nr:type VI secretion system lipoprotein TssJ [Vibrio nereis]
MRAFGLVVLSILFVGGCSLANYVVPAYAKLDFVVSEEVNPDLSGRPSPVVIKVYELSSRTLFENHQFFELYDNPKNVLGPDLINIEEFEFYPGTTHSYDVSMEPGVSYVGVLVAYRDLSNARWREIIEVDNSGYESYEADIGRLAISVINK